MDTVLEGKTGFHMGDFNVDVSAKKMFHSQNDLRVSDHLFSR